MPGIVMPNLGLTSGWTTGENGWGEAVNRDIRKINELAHLAVINATTTSPPGTPANGDRYIVPAGATGLWGGQTDAIVVRQSGVWVFYEPQPGWVAFDMATGSFRHYSGSAWTDAVMVTGKVRSNLHLAPSYDDDAAAAAGGVELGEEYRNGNFKMVRLT